MEEINSCYDEKNRFIFLKDWNKTSPSLKGDKRDEKSNTVVVTSPGTDRTISKYIDTPDPKVPIS